MGVRPIKSWAVFGPRKGSDWPPAGHVRLILNTQGHTIPADKARQMAAELVEAADEAEGKNVGPMVVTRFIGTDGVPVVQIDTQEGDGRIRINVNDGVVFDADPDLGD